jgi:hypothetical protein
MPRPTPEGRKGDTLVVCPLDRLNRSLGYLGVTFAAPADPGVGASGRSEAEICREHPDAARREARQV